MHLTIHRSPFWQLDNTDLWPYALRSVGRQLRDAPTPKGFGVVICFSLFEAVPHALLPCQTWPTWAYPAHYTPALASSASCCNQDAIPALAAAFCLGVSLDLSVRPEPFRRSLLKYKDQRNGL